MKISSVASRYLAPLLLYTIIASTAAAQDLATGANWEQEREQYNAALQLLERGQLSRFRTLSEQLAHYPLAPYLEYHYLRKRIDRTKDQRVIRFVEEQADTPLAPRIRHLWLRQLAARGQWQTYLENYPSTQSVELQCYELWARHKMAETTAVLDAVKSIWLVDHSQPDACNPLFKLWRDHGRLNDKLVLKRFSMAMRAGNTQLARYLIRFISAEKQPWARLYREVYFRPERVKQLLSGSPLESSHRQILLHGLQRLASREATLAEQYLEKLDNPSPLTRLQYREIQHRILLRHARNNNSTGYRALLADYPHKGDVRLTTAATEMFIRLRDWQAALKSMESLPSSQQQTHRWRYWKARATLETASQTSREAALEMLSDLALERDYYGFMAADSLNADYQLNQQNFQVAEPFLQQLKAIPSIIRATELYALGYELDARREWQFASRRFSNDQHYTAAVYAHQLGWHDQAIRSTIRAERWNDLQLRFPSAYEASIVTNAKNLGINEEWIFAIARQESAMTADARSSKGALGLMQLMPATAKMVSRKHGISYRNKMELINSDKNILIGSRYLSDLLTEFRGNVVHATAAYNAGPYRVKQWLKETAELPVDVWVESIPYAETRQYVKNVLTYATIFAYLRQSPDFRMATAQYLTKSKTPEEALN